MKSRGLVVPGLVMLNVEDPLPLLAVVGGSELITFGASGGSTGHPSGALRSSSPNLSFPMSVGAGQSGLLLVTSRDSLPPFPEPGAVKPSLDQSVPLKTLSSPSTRTALSHGVVGEPPSLAKANSGRGTSTVFVQSVHRS